MVRRVNRRGEENREHRVWKGAGEGRRQIMKKTDGSKDRKYGRSMQILLPPEAAFAEIFAEH